MPRALALLSALLFGLLGAPAALAQTPSGEACGAGTTAWVARCNASHGASITRAECPAAGLFIVTTPDGRVELNRAATRSFRRANGWGLSLVDENAPWASLPAARRASFERVLACVTSDGSLPTEGASPEALRALRGSPPPRPADPHRDPTGDRTGDPTGDRTGDDHRDHAGDASRGDRRQPHRYEARPSTPHRSGRDEHAARWVVPWRALLAAALLAVAWWPRRRRALAKLPRRAGAVAGASVAVLALRWWVYGPGFFHQNGQGPMWVESALGVWSPYGPGFAELFNLPARLSPAAPDLAVFAAQGLLAGLSLVAAWAFARRAMPATPGAPWLAAAVTSVLLVHPAVGRASVTESYLAAGLSLELLGAWALSHGHLPRGDAWARLRAVAPTLAGGLLLSLAVGVHPAGWAPAATVPLAVLATPGALRRRVKRAFVAYALVGAVVLVTAGPGVLEVLRGELGQRWAHRPPVNDPALHDALLAAGLIALVALAGARSLPRALACVLPLFPLAAVGPATDAITASGAREYIGSAFLWMHAPAAVALAAAALGGVPRRRSHAWALAALVVVGGVAWSARHFRAQTVHPADDLEQRAFLRWRDRLPPGATVSWLARADDHILALPLYPAVDPRGRRARPLRTMEGDASVPAGDRSYWYRASSCSTAEAHGFCERVERGLVLEPVVTAEYPGRWSLSHVPFDRERVPVGLYRVRGVR